MYLAVGIGSEIKYFPQGKDIIGIDISTEMLKRAGKNSEKYCGNLELKNMDARKLTFSDNSFDQVFTSCTFCSIPDPIIGLGEIKRVLKPGGKLNMFEHTHSLYFPYRYLLRMMNPIAEDLGPSFIRDTVSNVQLAGFKVEHVFNIYLDVVKTIHAVNL